jgi:O-acetylserine/cysteine efflux transporter
MDASRARLRPSHVLLALAVVAIWGTNFVVIKVGLRELPPYLFATLRFLFCAVPLVAFLARPKVRWRWLAAYGVLLGAGQFGLLFYAMQRDISPGLASLVIQTQVFFTIGLSVALFKERLRAATLAGSCVAAAGLALIAFHVDAGVTHAGVAMVLAAALCWAGANVVVKRAAREAAQPIDMLAFIAWSSLFAAPPLVALSLALEGWGHVAAALRGASLATWAAVAWQVLGNTLFGFAAWSWLLTRYDAAVISPYALLIPVFGLAASALLLGEPLGGWKLVAFALVLGGIAIHALAASRN